MNKNKLQMTEPIIVKKAGNNCMKVELFLRVNGRLPNQVDDVVDKALAKQYLDMWVDKKLDKYDDNTHMYAFHVYGNVSE